ncbi:aryl hydrocarbon receptor nuclear translocator-like protein 2 isoform X3 [Austrofundulus limnaeus]|uniref:Aryl hydrocarbon receptor nuclear translocator-like protein 2 isoform X3 n=1 Tax=Austrofundulus limnaeus TaxID=52670 RepID=A0A2I4C1L6_AUSLI|nr:PREDICTED: aryl hydrocarbon receptor nuclear translocator-like protein 2 isoform X3 [Austrofundulus limnaeus]
MSAGGSSGGTADKPADHAVKEEDEEEGEGPSQSRSSMPAVELPRKRKGVVEERSDTHVQQGLSFQLDDDLSRSEGEDQQVKMKCFRVPHRQIEKQRRDKMNNLIDELSAMIPACQPMPRKLDKLTVLRKAVQHLKALKIGTSSAFTDTTHKPSFLPHDELRNLLLRAADGFLLVVRCDRAKILFISESVSKILNFNQLELTGQSLFDFIHPKDISKVKEQLSSSEMFPHQHLTDASTGVQAQAEAPLRPSLLASGARRSFFCRMKHSRVTGKHDDKHSLPRTSKKKDSYRYCTLHCTGYMRSWPSSQLDPEGDAGDKETSSLNCLVTMCRLHPHVSPPPPRDVHVKATQFVTRCAIDEPRQSSVIYRRRFSAHRVTSTSIRMTCSTSRGNTVLRSKEKVETQRYKFKTKHGSYVSLQSQWFSFTNPWTKEVEFIVSLNRVILGPGHTKDEEEAGSSKALQEDSKQIPEIPGLASSVGTMIYAGSIGTQIANELMDSYRANSSPSSGAPSPFSSVQEKCLQSSRSASSQEEAAGSSSESQSDSKMAAGASSAMSEETGESSQLGLDSMLVPGLSSFSSDEAAMEVIWRLLNTDVSMGQSADFEDLHWPF